MPASFIRCLRVIMLLHWAALTISVSATNQSCKREGCLDTRAGDASTQATSNEFTPGMDSVLLMQRDTRTHERDVNASAMHHLHPRRGMRMHQTRQTLVAANPSMRELPAAHGARIRTVFGHLDRGNDSLHWYDRIELHESIVIIGPFVFVIVLVMCGALISDAVNAQGENSELLHISSQEDRLAHCVLQPEATCNNLMSPDGQSYWVPTHALSHNPLKLSFDIAASSASLPLHVEITELSFGRMVEVSAQAADRSEHVRIRPSGRSLSLAKSSCANSLVSLQVMGPGDEVYGVLEQRAGRVCLIKNDKTVLSIRSFEDENSTINADDRENTSNSMFGNSMSELAIYSGAGEKLGSMSRSKSEDLCPNDSGDYVEFHVLPAIDPALALACVLARCCWHQGERASMISDIDTVNKHSEVLAIMAAYGAQQPQMSSPAALSVINMNVPYRGTWRCLPILLNILVIALPLVLVFRGWVLVPLNILTLLLVWQGYKVGLHSVLFGYVGARKMRVYEGADFRALHFAERRLQERSVNALPLGTCSQSVDMHWEDVLHFVILPNYQEGRIILQRSLQSIAASEIASKQIGVVLAMEAREEGGMEKAEALRLEFAGQFRYFFVTEHPPNLPGEMPGKASNTQWAASQLFNVVFPQHSVDLDRAVITVADADSEFHPGYFSALTYNFLHAGGEDGETPWRYLSLWQPPIMHLKNYLTQPIILRLASIVASAHELANLSDTWSSRVLYSTYSISAKLAVAVNGWDPEWISEDWHMTLKCHLATAGRVKLQPIFLAVLNYAPEGDTWWETLCGRWAQAKRHALGYCEIVFFLDHFSRVFAELSGCSAHRRFCWQSLTVWFQMTMVHVTGSTFVLVSAINGAVIGLLCQKDIKYTFGMATTELLINIFFQSLTLVSFVCLCWVSVVLFMDLKPRITGAEDPGLSVAWRSCTLHFLCFCVPALILFPPFLVVAAAAEWIAAWQCASTHRFDYEVASKPKLSDAHGSGDSGGS